MARETNWQDNYKICWGPQFRLDCNNPQMGGDGSDVYSFYGVTDNKEQGVISLGESGTLRIYNDRTIEMVGGKINSPGGIDVIITSKHGDITITAEKNGNVRIRAKNIVLDADEDVKINAGKNVNIRAGTRAVIQANQVDADGITGNLVPQNSSFGEKVFGGGKPDGGGGASVGGAYVGKDVIQNAFFAEDIAKFSSGTISQATQNQSLLDQLIAAGVALVTGDGGDTGSGDCGDSGTTITEDVSLFTNASTQFVGGNVALTAFQEENTTPLSE